MFSGKSEELIRRVRRAIIAKKKVQVFKSHLDERYAGIYHVSSHDGRTVEAVPVDTPEQIARAASCRTRRSWRSTKRSFSTPASSIS